MKLLRNLGLVLIISGFIALYGYGLLSLLSSSDVPIFIKASIIAIGVGILVLLFYILYEQRVKKSKENFYKGYD